MSDLQKLIFLFIMYVSIMYLTTTNIVQKILTWIGRATNSADEIK